MDDHDITNQEILGTEMLVESQDMETNSKGKCNTILEIVVLYKSNDKLV